MFVVGDWVYIKLQPYAQLSVAKRSCPKLSYKYFGPYLITQRIGAVAYKLQLPSTALIHPVLHVSQLKRALPPNSVVSSDDQLQYITSTKQCVPLQVLERRMTKVGNKATLFGLIRWQHFPEDWTTWKNLQALKLSHPSFPAEVQV